MSAHPNTQNAGNGRPAQAAHPTGAIDRALVLTGLFIASSAVALRFGYYLPGTTAMMALLVLGAASMAVGTVAWRRGEWARWLAPVFALLFGGTFALAAVRLSGFLPGLVLPVAFATVATLLATLLTARSEAFCPDTRPWFVFFCTFYGMSACYFSVYFIHRYDAADWLVSAVGEVTWYGIGINALLAALLTDSIYDALHAVRRSRPDAEENWLGGLYLLNLLVYFYAELPRLPNRVRRLRAAIQ